MDDYVNLQKQIDEAKKEEEKEQPPEAQEESEEEVLVQLKPSASFENINSSEVDSIQPKSVSKQETPIKEQTDKGMASSKKEASIKAKG